MIADNKTLEDEDEDNQPVEGSDDVIAGDKIAEDVATTKLSLKLALGTADEQLT